MLSVYIDPLEYLKWLKREQNKDLLRYCSHKLNRKPPRQEKLRDFRLSRSPLNTGNYLKKEAAWVKEKYGRIFRGKIKRDAGNGVYYTVYARDYKTYGRITW